MAVIEPLQQFSLSHVVPSRHGNAPAAAFMLVELHRAKRYLDDVRIFVHDHYSAGT
jgi:hypothetical protein